MCIRDRALLALREIEVVGVKQRTRGIIYQSPSIARNQSFANRLFRLVPLRTIQRTCGALQIPRVIHPRMPGHLLTIHLESDREIFRREPAISQWVVGELQIGSIDRQPLPFALLRCV